MTLCARKLIVAAAQSNSLAGEIESNVQTHSRFVQVAVENDCDLIVFPELSLTGYEPRLAGELTMTLDDQRFAPLKKQARQSKITIIVGAPIARSDRRPFIGAFAFSPDKSLVYAKQHLHGGEEQFFSAGDSAGRIDIKTDSVGLAICADIANPTHPDEAAALGATIYAASVLITPGGYDADAALLQKYASRYQMSVVMANFAGPSGGLTSAGKSAIWDETGRLITVGQESGECLVVAERTDTDWHGRVVELPTM